MKFIINNNNFNEFLFCCFIIFSSLFAPLAGWGIQALDDLLVAFPAQQINFKRQIISSPVVNENMEIGDFFRKTGYVVGTLLLSCGISQIYGLCKDPTVILYHGNAMTAFEFSDEAKYYHDLGFNVLIPTMGGKRYVQSEQRKNNDTCTTSEVTLYQDVDGEIAFLQAKGVQEIGVHGLSIGSAKAFQAAAKHPNLVKFVVADKAFTTAQAVAENIARDLDLPGGKVAKEIVAVIDAPFVARAFSRAVLSPEINKSGYETDGLNNLAKVKKLQASNIELFVIESSNDALMGNVDGGNFAKDLFKARYSDAQQNEKEGQASYIFGDHNTSFLDSRKALQQLKTFTKSVPWSSGPNAHT